jgi:hypothetical protein
MQLSYSLLFLILMLSITFNVSAQQFPQSRNHSNMNIVHFYGKVLDTKTDKPVEAATVQLPELYKKRLPERRQQQ